MQYASFYKMTYLRFFDIVVWITDSELGCDDVIGAWTIDDLDNSFLSQPFRIRYARQDIFLCVMIFFNLSLGKNQVFFYLSSFSFTLVLITRLIRSKIFRVQSHLL